MRIAILTLPLHINFGGILQCYALQTVLERLGHRVEVLNTDVSGGNVSVAIRLSLFVKRLVKWLIGRESRFYGGRTENEIPRLFTDRFVRKNIKIRDIRSLSLLRENDYDAIVVGSDQIWRPTYYRPIADAFLRFAKDWVGIKRISYAASFGTTEWGYTTEETQECAALLQKFDAVSVREDSAVKLCREYFGVNAVQMIDPTLLLSKNDYLNLIDKIAPRDEKGLFYYFLDETQEKLGIVESLVEKYGINPFKANNPYVEKFSLNFEQRIQLPVEQWLAGFRDAQLVVTDSFHGCVFAILFNKPFVAIGNRERGLDRFVSLLSQLGLKKCLVADTEKEIKVPEISWSDVNSRLEYLKGASRKFLEFN